MGTLAAGIKDIFSTAKTTGTNVMLSTNDGTPDGHMTMENLASVLGVPTSLKNLKPMSGGDLNNIKDAGYYMFDGTVANRPTETSAWNAFFLAVIHENAGNQNMCTQIYISSAKGSMFKRSFTYSQGAWQDWQEFAFNIPAFYKSYSDLASLSSALNALDAIPVYCNASHAHSGTEYLLASSLNLSPNNNIFIYFYIEGSNASNAICKIGYLHIGTYAIIENESILTIATPGVRFEIVDNKLNVYGIRISTIVMYRIQ